MESLGMSGQTLRITQSSESTGKYRAELALEGDGIPRQTATAAFEFELADQHREDLRWYLEDYLQYPHDPAPTVAARIEGDIKDVGVDLFKKVFQSDDDARDLWATLRQKLDETRIEISTSVAEATSIPWELIRDPKTDAALALRAESFVRSQPQAAQPPELPQAESGPIRILLVICRPSGDDDVPFRSVATQLIKGLGDQAEDRFQLDVLRPATYERLSRVLNEAKSAGQPYHVVHFDGHGMYAEVPDTEAAVNWLQRLIPVVLSGPREGPHGFLLFEKPDHQSNMELVDGPTLGKLLVATDVPLLVLNACRSAHAEAPTEPKAGAGDDVHEQVRALGSLAQEVMDAGVAGVVAMRYNVYVVTAAQFVADMYQTLVQGRSLGESVSMGRKQLAAKPDRTISFDPRPLQDWCVPIVYEAARIELFPEREDDSKSDGPKITIRSGGSATDRGSLDEKLPRPPDVGFFGRDETLLALDRAFDTLPVVLLHAYAGSGKTCTAAEFARWYSLTGGVDGPVLFTSLETYTPLPRVLDRVGEVFGSTLEQSGVHWLTLEDDARRDVALQVLKQIPVLWIWDNVEPIAGFPGTYDGLPRPSSDTASSSGSSTALEGHRTSDYTPAERQALADFLRDVKQTQAKILLTSRRDEQTWLQNVPCRIAVPPMPMQERVQLARALAEHHQRRLTDVDDWRPLLRFTQGNPLTITVLVGQALRDGLKTGEQITTFVEKLRAGEAAFDDEASEGRTRSLGASLSYGFTHAFTADQRRILALLHLFQGFVDVRALQLMGNPKADWCLDALRGLTRDEAIGLLDRAADVGLLRAHGGGYYTIHPALPWFFKSLFDACTDHPPDQPEGASPRLSDEQGEPDASAQRLMATRAFVEAMGQLGDYYCRQYSEGNRDVIGALSAEEANLLHARRLARTHGWWDPVTSAMQGLRNLYDQTGRRAEWRRLVDEIVPDFVDPATDGPLPGREERWSMVTGYRVGLAEESRHWDEAERLQRVRVEWNRRRADEVIAAVETRRVSEGTAARDEISLADASGFLQRLQAAAAGLDGADRNTIRTLGVSLHELGEIQRERQQPKCVTAYEESLAVAEAIDDRAAAATSAFNLGHSYWGIYVPAIRDLAKAEQWYRRSLELYHDHERHDRAQCLGQLGAVARERFKESREAGEPAAELLRHVNEAVQSYQQALELLPDNAVNDLAVTHNQLGNTYINVGDIDRALPHFRKCIRYDEASGNQYGAAQARSNVAIALLQSDRLSDARQYALAARRDYQSYGDRAADEIAQTEQLLAHIEQAIQEQEK
jgi:tetratricopeptide (TPR) repeat protein